MEKYCTVVLNVIPHSLYNPLEPAAHSQVPSGFMAILYHQECIKGKEEGKSSNFIVL